MRLAVLRIKIAELVAHIRHDRLARIGNLPARCCLQGANCLSAVFGRHEFLEVGEAAFLQVHGDHPVLILGTPRDKEDAHLLSDGLLV
jgi:hypothetical protein